MSCYLISGVLARPVCSTLGIYKMNLFRLVLLIFFSSLTPTALASDCGQPISVEAVIKLSGTITLGDLKTKFGEWCQGHGPASWYQGSQGKQIWFWWKMPSQPATTDAEGMKYQVLLATEVNAKDSDDFKIIWPQEFVGRDFKAIAEKEYGTQKSNH